MLPVATLLSFCLWTFGLFLSLLGTFTAEDTFFSERFSTTGTAMARFLKASLCLARAGSMMDN